eukprot:ANDGO_07066.mRNA.1 Dynein 18 kDa light chain
MEILTAAEIESARKIFSQYDDDKSGKLSIYELKKLLNETAGGTVSFDQIKDLLQVLDGDGSLEFGEEEFLEMQRVFKRKFKGIEQDPETISAFVSLGGNPDRTGHIIGENLLKVCTEMGLTIRVKQLLEEFDTDGSGFLDFDEFSSILREQNGNENRAKDG